MVPVLPLNPRTMPDGVILILNVRYSSPDGPVNGTIYSHAALKSGGFWYLTGSRAPQVAGWGAVERWLERDGRDLHSVKIMIGTKTIWPEPVEVAVADCTPDHGVGHVDCPRCWSRSPCNLDDPHSQGTGEMLGQVGEY